MDYATLIAEAALDIGAIKINAEKPFQWASGYQMPIYNNNRRLLMSPSDRYLITDAFVSLIQQEGIDYDVIAGTSTAGIAPGVLLADRLNVPFSYVRDKPKGHGLQSQVEGPDEDGYNGKKVIVIEDLISTGGSSARAVEGVRDANGEVESCLSIFNYGMKEAEDTFGSLDPACTVHSLLTYDQLLDVALKNGYLSASQEAILREWGEDQSGWGEKHGFPRVEQ